MKSALINKGKAPTQFEKWSMMTFPSWKALYDFAKKIQVSQACISGNQKFAQYVNEELRKVEANAIERKFSEYGLDNKQPKSYADAMKREKFIYFDNYKRIKSIVEKRVKDWVANDSTAQAMQSKLIFNDKAIGEFVFSKAAMSLRPKVVIYCPKQDREVFPSTEVIINDKEKMFLGADGKKGDELVLAFKIKVKSTKANIDDLGTITKKTKKIDGAIYNLFEPKGDREDVESELLAMGFMAEMIENQLWVRKGTEQKKKFIFYKIGDNPKENEKILKKINKKGVLEVVSDNKKVYLYKEIKPKKYRAIKIVVGLVKGGFTNWINNFYTGVAAVVVAEQLEALGYTVAIEVVVGGGRCGACHKQLNFDNQLSRGRRYFSFMVKNFGEPMELDTLLYTVADPSFHNVKWISLLNNFFSFFNDEISQQGSPDSTWHGIEGPDMVNPIGMYIKSLDIKRGDKNLLHFYFHKVGATVGGNPNARQVADEKENIEVCVEYITTTLKDVLNINKIAMDKAMQNKII